MSRRIKLVSYNGTLYHPNFFKRRLQCIEIYKNICQHCGKKRGDEYVAATGRKHKVVIQAAHLDHDPWNKDARLLALCKQCHMRYDGPMHGKRGSETKKRRAIEAQMEAGQTLLPGFHFMLVKQKPKKPTPRQRSTPQHEEESA